MIFERQIILDLNIFHWHESCEGKTLVGILTIDIIICILVEGSFCMIESPHTVP